MVPVNYEGIFREIENINPNLEIIRTLNVEGTGINEKFTTKSSPKTDLFSVQELTVINKVIEKFEGMTVQEIVAINHKEKAWLENEMHRKVISYQDAFALNPF